MSDVNESWTFPVEFYFSVQFHMEGQPVTVSFTEASGLDAEFVLQETEQIGSDGVKILHPQSVKHGDIVLKRAVEPLSEKLSQWANKCLNFMENGFISPCDVVISLMNSKQEIVASWMCTRAYPKKWNLSTLDAQKSGLAIETMTLTYNLLVRKK